jgi:hypothetical protein
MAIGIVLSIEYPTSVLRSNGIAELQRQDLAEFVRCSVRLRSSICKGR